VPRALELREPVEHVGKAQMDVGRGRVDPELHAQRTAELHLSFELLLGQHVDRVAHEVLR
jgi:hypothetical protein